jgi:uncharacterized membrane protein YtjA (UPF0391 family)
MKTGAAMAPFTCPKCAACLSPQEVADGWCEACGKKLPPTFRATVAAAPGNSGILPNAGWADRILFAVGLLFVVTLLVVSIMRNGLPGVWKWLQAMFLFVIFLSLVNMLERYCQLYPHWRSAYRVCAVVCVLAGMAFAVLIVLTRWRPFF